MIQAIDITLQYGKRVLFKDVNIKFTHGNCYGLIGANGAGKSTFLKILSGDIDPDVGEISIDSNERMAVLKQDQFQYDDCNVLQTVIMGHKKLYEIMKEKDDIYAKEDFSDEDGIRASELEAEFAEMNGWEAENDAAILLSGLGITEDKHDKEMKDLESVDKIRVLLAQALFGNPDILLLDEPTNNLDIASIKWLEEFLVNFDNTVIVVSHDRHFLNQVCTHIADIDYSKITLYSGNYDFWYESSQLLRKQLKDQNKKNEEKIKELKDFIRRFSSNASKSKQATSRKKVLDKIDLNDLKPSSRKFPYINFKPNREAGKELLRVESLKQKDEEGNILFDDFSLIVNKGDKIAFVGPNGLAKSAFFETITGEQEQLEGEYTWGQTITYSYFPKENSSFFDTDLNLVDWLRQYSEEKDETFIRGFLGRMLFSGEESQKSARVLSGGEKVRCMVSRLMLSGANFLILDEPTNHLDLESISSLNDALIEYDGTILFTSQDHQFIHTVANRIVEITPKGIIDKLMTFDEYIEDEKITALRDEYWSDSKAF